MVPAPPHPPSLKFRIQAGTAALMNIKQKPHKLIKIKQPHITTTTKKNQKTAQNKAVFWHDSIDRITREQESLPIFQTFKGLVGQLEKKKKKEIK